MRKLTLPWGGSSPRTRRRADDDLLLQRELAQARSPAATSDRATLCYGDQIKLWAMPCAGSAATAFRPRITHARTSMR